MQQNEEKAKMNCDIYLANKKTKKVRQMRASLGIDGTIFVELLIVACLLCLAGCTLNSYFAKDAELADAMTMLREIKVSGEGKDTKIEILANKPLKYTLHTIIEPPREVIDLALTNPGSVKAIIEINSSIIKRIDITQNSAAGHPFTRIIIKLVRHVDFSARTDPANENRLLLTVAEHQESPKAK